MAVEGCAPAGGRSPKEQSSSRDSGDMTGLYAFVDAANNLRKTDDI